MRAARAHNDDALFEPTPRPETATVRRGRQWAQRYVEVATELKGLTAQRPELIRALRKEGWTVPEVSELLGLSVDNVYYLQRQGR